MTGESSKQLPKIYAQYSDMYVPGMNLNDNMVRNIYQMELMKIRIDKTYMGMWQMYALSSVLKSPIFSIYPKFGNPNVRSDLNRIVMPRNQLSTQRPVLYILWRRTRHNDMMHEHWIPNHFVPVLPIAAANESIENGNMETQSEINGENVESGKAEECVMEMHTEMGVINEELGEVEIKENMSDVDKSVEKDDKHMLDNTIEKNDNIMGKSETGNVNGEAFEQLTKDTQCESQSGAVNGDDNEKGKIEMSKSGDDECREKSEMVQNRWEDITDPSNCVGKYVIVEYDDKPYPGYVDDAGQRDVYVECMHRIGKNFKIASTGLKKLKTNAGMTLIIF